ncbi:MAG: hypothetical protein HYX48_07675 [Chlamydiales bacterium]|nr:hypothetical protein [Chlamydiales bacterium]
MSAVSSLKKMRCSGDVESSPADRCTALPSSLLIHTLGLIGIKALSQDKTLSVCQAFYAVRTEVFNRQALTGAKQTDETLYACTMFSKRSLKIQRSYTQILDLMSNVRKVKLCDPSRAMLDGVFSTQRASQLLSLAIQESPLNRTFSRIPEACPNLRTLSFFHCNALRDKSLRDFTSLKRLRSITFFSCSNISEEAAKTLSKIPTLTEVSFVHCVNITRKAVKTIFALPSLTSLELSMLPVSENEERLIAREIAKRGSRITDLNLSLTGLGPEHLLPIARACQALRKMDLTSYAHIPDPIGLKGAMERENPKLEILGLTPGATSQPV